MQDLKTELLEFNSNPDNQLFKLGASYGENMLLTLGKLRIALYNETEPLKKMSDSERPFSFDNE